MGSLPAVDELFGVLHGKCVFGWKLWHSSNTHNPFPYPRTHGALSVDFSASVPACGISGCSPGRSWCVLVCVGGGDVNTVHLSKLTQHLSFSIVPSHRPVKLCVLPHVFWPFLTREGGTFFWHCRTTPSRISFTLQRRDPRTRCVRPHTSDHTCIYIRPHSGGMAVWRYGGMVVPSFALAPVS